MDLNLENEKQHFLELWNKRKHVGIEHTGKAWDERSVGWVKELEENDIRAKRSARRVAETVEYLVARGVLNENVDVIDIGCGPGRFVAEFAKHSHMAYGADISSKMCEFGKEFALSQGLNNVEYFPCDFNQIDVNEAGWEKKFDLVFSSITPAMSRIENMRKAEAMSRKYCFQSNFIKTVDSVGEEVLNSVLTEEQMPVERDLRAFYTLFNILLLEGKKPETKYFLEEEDVRCLVDDELVGLTLKMVKKDYITDEVRAKVKKAYMDRADENGYITTHREWHYGWILWEVNGK